MQRQQQVQVIHFKISDVIVNPLIVADEPMESDEPGNKTIRSGIDIVAIDLIDFCFIL